MSNSFQFVAQFYSTVCFNRISYFSSLLEKCKKKNEIVLCQTGMKCVAPE